MTENGNNAPSGANIDVAIIGAGISGLWTLNALRARGYSALLIERNALGGGQTIAAQGVIHGGLKYAAGGLLNDASEALAAMPDRWRTCLSGEADADIDLSSALYLAPCQHLWTKGGATSAVAGFFASKMLKSRIKRLASADFPPPLDHSAYRGHVFELGEFAVDTTSVLEALARPHQEFILKAEVENFQKLPDGKIQIDLPDSTIHCRHLVLTAGAGNADCLKKLDIDQRFPMQRRPLHQVLVKHPDLPPFYSVCLGTSPKPPMVCTTHRHQDGTPVWYLGGDLAESGVDRDRDQQIRAARDLLRKLLPWVKLDDAEWSTLRIDRAEAMTPDRSRHPGAWVETEGSVTAVWPSKLALAPDAADHVVRQVVEKLPQPSSPSGAPLATGAPVGVAPAPWDTANYERLP